MSFSLQHRISRIGGSRGEFVRNSIPESADRVLDIGCAFGWDLGALSGRASELVGVDVNEASLQKARAAYPHIHFLQASATDLPFESETFDVTILSEVIEHVGESNKQAVVDEAFRVLRPGGTLIFTAPFDGATAWADPLDFKRRFPAIYRVYMRISGYAPKTDIEVGHQHVSLAELEILFDGRFTIETIEYCGFFSPFITWILTAGERTGLFSDATVRRLNGFRSWEDGVEYPRRLAYNVRIVAKKPPGDRTTKASCNRTKARESLPMP
jgi:SAM-dependent methyltransferase